MADEQKTHPPADQDPTLVHCHVHEAAQPAYIDDFPGTTARSVKGSLHVRGGTLMLTAGELAHIATKHPQLMRSIRIVTPAPSPAPEEPKNALVSLHSDAQPVEGAQAAHEQQVQTNEVPASAPSEVVAPPETAPAVDAAQLPAESTDNVRPTGKSGRYQR